MKVFLAILSMYSLLSGCFALPLETVKTESFPLVVMPPASTPGGTLEIRLDSRWFSLHPPGTEDWVGFFAEKDSDNSKPIWRAKVEPSSVKHNMSLNAPQITGRYQVRYFSGKDTEVRALRSSLHPVVECQKKSQRARTRIEHLVVVIQENHTFDNYFGRYCKAPTGSNPKCTLGRFCCEAGPEKDPGTGKSPIVLSEEEHKSFDPNHSSKCELEEMNGGKMDHFLKSSCGGPRTFAYAEEKTVKKYWKLADQYALGDRVFQSVSGASSSNNMYLSEARFVFRDNEVYPVAKGSQCSKVPQRQYHHATVGDLMNACGVSWTFYAEGYQEAVRAYPKCLGEWPKFFDPSDIPFSYYESSADNPRVMQDISAFHEAIKKESLPAVSFLKGIGWKTEHPGYQIKMSDGINFATSIVDEVLKSHRYASNTFILIIPDESGGYFDHVSPPPVSSVDGEAYGPRVFLLAIGNFVRKGHISHVSMELSSIVRFIEWNWLAGEPGQLGNRDATVNGLESLLDLKKVTRY